MANVKSYAWGVTLSEVVAIGAEAVVNTPGFIDPPSYKTDEVEVAHGGTVLTPDQFTATWEGDFTHVHLMNNTAADWPPGDTLYVTVAGIPFDAANAEASFDALEARVTNNEATITALDVRVTALESVAGLAAPPTRQVEEPPAPPAHKRGPETPKPGPDNPKEKPGAAHWDPSDIGEADDDEEHGRKGGKKHK
jgi:hypothetical protein